MTEMGYEDTEQTLAHHLVDEEIADETRFAVLEEVGKLLDAGMGGLAALDVYAIDVIGVDINVWADVRDVEPSSIRVQLSHGRSDLKEAIADD